MFHKIVVAIGDCSCADQLKAAAISLASGTDAEVLFVHVSEWSACCGAADHPALHEHERDLLTLLVDNLAARGIRAGSERRVTASGRVVQHLLDVATESSADLLIVPAGREGRLRGGSWSRVVGRLLREAPCPVLVLRSSPSAATRQVPAPGRLRLWRRWPRSETERVGTSG